LFFNQQSKEKFVKIFKLTLFLIFVFIAQKLVFAQPEPSMTFGESIDFAIERLKTNGIISLHTGIRPLVRSEIIQALKQSEARIEDKSLKISGINSVIFDKLKQEFYGDSFKSNVSEGFSIRAFPYSSARLSFTSDDREIFFSPSARVALRYQKGNNFILHQEFEISREENKYPVEGKTASQRLHLWKLDYIADFTRVYLSFALSKFQIKFGRDKLFWGHGYRDALGISDNSPPFDLILFSGKFGPIKGQSFMAQLDEMWHDRVIPTPYRYLANRYLAGHRIDYKFSERLEFAVSEIVLYGGESRGIEWEYFNPVLPYYASQHNADWDDNVMFLFDIETIPINGMRIYGSTLIDDLQYSGEGPDAWALMLGAHLSEVLLKKSDWRVEYTKLNRWVYTHRKIENQYTHFGSIIGHRLGNDSDEFFFEFSNYLNVDTLVKFNYDFTRQGEATVEDRFWGDERDLSPNPKRKRHEFGMQFLYEPIYGWQMELKFLHIIRQVYGKKQNELLWKNENQLELTIGYEFSH